MGTLKNMIRRGQHHVGTTIRDPLVEFIIILWRHLNYRMGPPNKIRLRDVILPVKDNLSARMIRSAFDEHLPPKRKTLVAMLDPK